MSHNDAGLCGTGDLFVLDKPPQASSDAVSAPAQTASAQALKILILEDEPTDAELMQRELRQAALDFTARRVDTRAGFIAALETFAPDIVLADYRLPGFTGAEALAHVRQIHPEVPVVIVSGVLGDEAAVELLKTGAVDYVLKGNLARLPAAVERAISVEHGIRARKAAEQALRATNALLQTVERIAHTGGFDWDIASGTIVWSEETYWMFGLVPGEFLPSISRFVDCIHPDDRARVQQAIAASVARNQPFDAEFRILRPDKAERIIQSRGELVRDEAGKPSRMTGTSQDITDRREAERTLAFERTILATEHELSPDGILVVDSGATIVSFNRRFGEIMNVPPELLAARKDEPVLAWVTDHMADPEGFLSRVRYLNEHLDENSVEEIVLKDGRVLDRHSMPLRLADSDYLGRVWFFRDISERKEAEHILRRLNRTLRTLSRGNEALVRAISEPELLTEMCRVIVETGGYRMAWVGVPQEDAAKSVRPVAWAGDVGDYLDKAQITWADEPRGRGLIGRAIRGGESINIQEIATDPGMVPWREEAGKRGYASSIALPLKDGSGVFAALTLYSAEVNAFDTDELKLLQELADDLAFGIRSLRDRRAHETLNLRWRTSLEATVGAIANTVEMRDPYTSGHQQRVARLAVAVAREMGLPEQQIQGLYLAGIIHDVGKINIPAEILNKPGKISKLEYQLIQGHAEAGYDIVKGVDFPWPIADIVRQHHERLDGSGYPQGLKGEAILPEARILSVADVVEAMMSHRPYRAALGIDAALAEIEKGRGSIFDSAAVDACILLFRHKGFAFE